MRKIMYLGEEIDRKSAQRIIECQQNVIAHGESVISNLQAQLDAPEPVEFWEGQLLQHDNGMLCKYVRPYDDGEFIVTNEGHTLKADWCRPLQDPLIDQYKPLADGELIPETHHRWVRIKKDDGSVFSVNPVDFNKFRTMHSRILGWMPAAGWGMGG